jgi:hypothetical protein
MTEVLENYDRMHRAPKPNYIHTDQVVPKGELKQLRRTRLNPGIHQLGYLLEPIPKVYPVISFKQVLNGRFLKGGTAILAVTGLIASTCLLFQP